MLLNTFNQQAYPGSALPQKKPRWTNEDPAPGSRVPQLPAGTSSFPLGQQRSTGALALPNSGTWWLRAPDPQQTTQGGGELPTRFSQPMTGNPTLSQSGTANQTPNWAYSPSQSLTPQGGTAAIQSSITPQSIFSDADTQMGVNQIMGQGYQSAYGAPTGSGIGGISSASPAMQAQDQMNRAGSLSEAMGGAEQLRLSDANANAMNLLGGQRNRFADALGQATAQAGFNDANRSYGSAARSSLIDAILARMGGISGQAGQGIGDDAFWANLGMAGGTNALQEMLNTMRNASSLSDLSQTNWRTSLYDSLLA
jgi:hypothetical protein